MYISDKNAAQFLGLVILVIGPLLGVTFKFWGWMLDIALLLAFFFISGREENKGKNLGIALLALGYMLPIIIKGVDSLMYMSFIPLAGFVTLWARKKGLSQGIVVFWSLVTAGILGATPTLFYYWQGIPQESTQGLVQAMIEQYREAGLLDSFAQQGIAESDVEGFFQQVLNVVILITPGLAAIGGFLKWGVTYLFYLRWQPKAGWEYRPFTEWRLPWYGIWGMNLAIVSFLLGDIFQWVILKNLGINLMLVFGAVALVLGSALFVSFLQKPWISNFLKIILLFTSFLYFQFTAIVLILMGLLDMVLDFRQRSIKPKKK